MDGVAGAAEAGVLHVSSRKNPARIVEEGKKGLIIDAISPPPKRPSCYLEKESIFRPPRPGRVGGKKKGGGRRRTTVTRIRNPAISDEDLRKRKRRGRSLASATISHASVAEGGK